MTSEETQRHFALRASLAPTRSALYEDPQLTAAGAPFVRQKTAFRGAVPRPVTPMYPAVSGALQRFLSTAIATRDSDLERLAAEADREIDHYVEMAQ
jgi:multiple sugar transport system substrate-binding protein